MKHNQDPEVQQINNIKPRGLITERVDFKSLQKVNLAALIFKGTAIPDLANYPKKPKTKF